jgi:hypothetical protein
LTGRDHAVGAEPDSNPHMSMNWLPAFAGLLLVGLLSDASAATPANAPAPDKAMTLDTDPHLVGWWRFDEASGKRAADSSKQGHHGTLEGGLSFDTHSAPGRIGQAIKFDGQDGCIRATGYKGVTGPGPRTVAVWVKTTASEGELVSWGLDDHGKLWMFGHIRGHVGVTPKGGYLYMKAGVNDDAWHHVAVVVQEAAPPNLHDHVKLFKDGEPAEIDDIGLLDLWPIETGDKLELRIGWRFKGLLDDLRLYDRALAEDEINALFRLESNRPLVKPQ